MKRARLVFVSVLFFSLALGFAMQTEALAQEPPVISIELNELWRRGGDDDDLFFGNIDRIVVDPAGKFLRPGHPALRGAGLLPRGRTSPHHRS